MKTYKLHLIRHGLTRANLEGIYAGSGTDLPLCPEGRAQLEALRRDFEYPNVPLVITSPMLRARETADIGCRVPCLLQIAASASTAHSALTIYKKRNLLIKCNTLYAVHRKIYAAGQMPLFEFLHSSHIQQHSMRRALRQLYSPGKCHALC